MRIEPFVVGSYVHALKRGGRGMPIVKEDADRWRFLRLLFYMNDEYFNEWWNQETDGHEIFYRPNTWPNQKPIVNILCYILMPNHFHLLLKEKRKGGIAKYMQKIGQSMTLTFNEKYNSKGSIFQGSYKGRTVTEDEHLRYLAAYIMVKNSFELFPGGGLEVATQNFDRAWEWAMTYQFSSLADYGGKRLSPIIDKDILGEIFKSPKEFKSFAREVIEGGRFKKERNDREGFLPLLIE